MEVTTAIIECIFAVILCMLLLLILVKSCRYLLCKKTLVIADKQVYVLRESKNRKKRKIKKEKLKISFEPYTRYATICSLTASFFATISALYAMITITMTLKMNQTSLMLAFSLWYIARILMNCVFVDRLHSFNNTQWNYGKYVFYFFYTLLSFIIFISILEIMTLIVAAQLHGKYTIIIIIGVVLFALMILLDILCSIVLSVLFQRKILQLIKSYFLTFQQSMKHNEKSNNIDINDNCDKLDDVQSQRTHTTVSLPDVPSVHNHSKTWSELSHQIFYSHLLSDARVGGDKNDNFEMDITDNRRPDKDIFMKEKLYNHGKLELINTITQHTILICSSLITSLMVLFIAIIASIVIFEQRQKSQLAPIVNGWFYFVFSIVVDSFVNSLCLYFHFPFSSYKSLCSKNICLHKICLAFVAKYIDKRIAQ